MPGDGVRSVVTSAAGIRLHMRERGGTGTGSRPEALLLHGLASSCRIWDPVADRLSRAGMRSVALDQRGHGRSAKPSSGYGFDRITADALAVIRAAKLRAPIVVGHSWGANVALELAVRHRSAVRGAVLVDGGFLALRDRFDWPAARQALAPPQLAGMSLDAFLAGARTHLGSSLEITPEIIEVLRSLVRVDRSGRIRPRLSRANHLRILHALWEQDTIGLLERLRVPTLVLAVRSPAGVPDSAGFMRHKRLAAARVRSIGPPVNFAWIDGIHDVPLQRPRAVAGRILRFADATDARSPRRS